MEINSYYVKFSYLKKGQYKEKGIIIKAVSEWAALAKVEDKIKKEYGGKPISSRIYDVNEETGETKAVVDYKENKKPDKETKETKPYKPVRLNGKKTNNWTEAFSGSLSFPTIILEETNAETTI